jgi:hypothetical protein
MRFLADILLGETVKQYVVETLGVTEEGYGGYGLLYAAEATRVGERLGTGPVVEVTVVPACRSPHSGPGRSAHRSIIRDIFALTTSRSPGFAVTAPSSVKLPSRGCTSTSFTCSSPTKSSG